MKTKKYKNLMYILLIVGIFAMNGFSIIKNHTYSTQLGFFEDENVYNEAAVQFFTDLNYSSPTYKLNDPFDVRVTNGIGNTWPSGFAYVRGMGQTSARFIQSCIVQIFFILLMTLAFRKLSLSIISSIFLSSFVWMISMRLPYWHGYIQNLGELPSAIWFSFGLLIIKKHPRWASFLFGVSVWLGKFIYFPFAVFVILAVAYAQRASWQDKLKTLIQLSFIFALPLICWMSLILIKYGVEDLLQWCQHYYNIVFNSKVSKTSSTLTIAERFQSLEWGTYTKGTKIKLVILLFSSFALFLDSLIKRVEYQKLYWFVSLAMIAGIFLNIIYYALWHPFMWVRYLQPAIYFSFLGFSLLLVLRLSSMVKRSKNVQLFLLSLALCLTALELVLLLKM